LAASAVGDRDRIDLDQVPGSGERLHSHHGVGWLVLAEQELSGPLDDRQVLGPVVDDVDRDLGDLFGAGAGGGQGATEVGVTPSWFRSRRRRGYRWMEWAGLRG
jgi:hypothetical protein